MLIQFLLFLLLGIFFGTITGLIPGIHINLISIILISIYFTTSINPIYFIVFIVAMAITHTFIDFIPSIFLGCPDTDTELSILPGHELLKKGQGYQAVILTAYGSLAAIFILIIITLPSIFLISKTYNIIQKFIPYFLILISILLITLERKKFSAFLAFSLTGILGYLVLNMEFLKEPILPLLTGLFGASMLIISIKNKIKIPKQEIVKPKINFFRPLIGAVIASPLCSFFPGLGSGQAAIIGNLISKTNRKDFLFLLGATNTLVMGFSFISLYIISRTRTGAAIAIKEIIQTLTPQTLTLILIVVLISGIISFFLTIYLTKFFSQKIEKVNYTLLCFITLSILIIITLLISGILGIIILIISTITGIYCISLGVKKTQMMGCLLVPTILFYLL